jgi:nitrogen-specific signal transduction histidine kinase/ActR/RegA family two-component response regulator
MLNSVAGRPVIAAESTDVKQRERPLRQAQKLEALGRLASGVAHDFNNLLTVINGYGELLLKRMPADNPLRGAVEQIAKAGSQAAGLTRQLLAFARQQDVEPAVLDLNQLIQELEKMLRRLIGEDINLTTVLAPQLHAVRADPCKMEQILVNLAVNARDAMPKGGRLSIETCNVTLEVAREDGRAKIPPGGYVMVTVKDTGCGMAPEVLARVFEPFFTTKDPEHGTGLGLANVASMVEEAGGHITVHSTVGAGTTFAIYLPRQTVSSRPSSAPSAAPALARGTETILLVEDEVAVLTLARTVLTNCGYKVLEASCGPEALRLAQQHPGPIHLLVTDVIMPDMNGRDLADCLTALRPGLKSLCLSGYSRNVISARGAQELGLPLLQKPFGVGQLANKVREVLDQSRN